MKWVSLLTKEDETGDLLPTVWWVELQVFDRTRRKKHPYYMSKEKTGQLIPTAKTDSIKLPSVALPTILW